MKKKKTKLLCYFVGSFLTGICHAAPSYQIIAHLLNWIPAPLSPCSSCSGYFLEPREIREHPTPPPYKTVPTTITAEGPTIFSKTGESILQKNVRVTQTGRLIRADKAYIYRDKHTGKITHITLIGHVHVQEHHKLLISDKATFDLKNNDGQLDHLVYRMTQVHPRMGENNGWGSAEKANTLPDGRIILNHATFSTCSPLHPTWIIEAQYLEFDRNKKKGVAHNISLKLGGFPIFYSPYLSFSFDHARKSGFLFPHISSSTLNGFTVHQPYYWNMAPNYDMTITPTYYANRGFALETLFRYISENSIGNLYASDIFNDKKFADFKNTTLSQFPEPINPIFRPYLNAIRNSGNNRGYFAFNDTSQLNDQWRLSTQLNYVTDDYYLHDFGTVLNEAIANQLLNQLELDYEGTGHWDFTFLTEAYQTLHLINQIGTPTVDQYLRLPELDTTASYPAFLDSLDFELDMQAVNFAYYSDFPPRTDQLPVGQRFHLRPTLTRSINWASGYFTPSVSLDSTNYNVTRPPLSQKNSSSRNLPIVNIDTGLYFNRLFTLHNNDYSQTFEPRLFYLYVPYENQNIFPVYDTQLLPFTFSQLFAVNRFAGYDRLENANQVSLGLTSRLFDMDNANQILLANIGIGYYFDKPRVCLTPDCALENKHWTPLTAELTYYPTPHWAITGNIAWDFEPSVINNAQVNVAYTQDGRHIIGGGYIFVHDQPGLPNHRAPRTIFPNQNSEFYTVFLAWPLMEQWSTVGHIYYNATQQRFESFFAGLQYDTCCISLRFIVNRDFLGTSVVNAISSNGHYNTSYIFQIQLKGIGSAGNSNPSGLLESVIPGYQDPFKY